MTIDPTVIAAPAEPRARPSVRLISASAALALLVAGAGYWWAGSPDAASVGGGAPPGFAATEGPPHAASGAQDGRTAGDLSVMVERLAERMKQRPDDAVGFAMLGRSYLVLGRYDEAVAAYERALKITPQEASLVADYAESVAMKNGRSLDGEPTKLIERALKIDPKNVKALSLAGAAAFQRSDFAGAVAHWQRVVELGAPDDPSVQQARDGIDEARAAGKLPGAAAPAATTAPAPAVAGAKPGAAVSGSEAVSGTVTLAGTLKGRAAADDTVFIFARAAEGSRMPLAILRKQVKDLPAEFRLDDSLAMSPATRLSTAQRVIVGARISKSGQAMPQPGDFEGLSAPVAVGTAGLKIEIAAPVK